MSSKTDWDRIGAMTDDAIDTTNVPAAGRRILRGGGIAHAQNFVPVTVHVDSDTLAWFQSQGEQCEPCMNAALRIYAEAHRQ